jgi:hypothetical protein
LPPARASGLRRCTAAHAQAYDHFEGRLNSCLFENRFGKEDTEKERTKQYGEHEQWVRRAALQRWRGDAALARRCSAGAGPHSLCAGLAQAMGVDGEGVDEEMWQVDDPPPPSALKKKFRQSMGGAAARAAGADASELQIGALANWRVQRACLLRSCRHAYAVLCGVAQLPGARLGCRCVQEHK